MITTLKCFFNNILSTTFSDKKLGGVVVGLLGIQ
jgi:hypothetical protein